MLLKWTIKKKALYKEKRTCYISKWKLNWKKIDFEIYVIWNEKYINWVFNASYMAFINWVLKFDTYDLWKCKSYCQWFYNWLLDYEKFSK